jgi:hypothetical protein
MVQSVKSRVQTTNIYLNLFTDNAEEHIFIANSMFIHFYFVDQAQKENIMLSDPRQTTGSAVMLRAAVMAKLD